MTWHLTRLIIRTNTRFPFLDPIMPRQNSATRKTIILTFGLLSPSKVSNRHRCRPGIIKSCRMLSAFSVQLPKLVRLQGGYFESLMTRVRKLGIEDHVIFFNQFVDR